jgi:Tfp pilus assembly protein PilX
MSARKSTAQRLRTHAAEDPGYAMVIVMMLLLIALLMGAAGLAESLDSHALTSRDGRERRAQQAADAGVQSQLYQASETNFAAAYNFTGGVLGLGTFLDCTVPQLDVNLNLVALSAYASSAGACPSALLSGGTTTTSTAWRALDNHAYYASEFFTNKKEANGTGVGSVVEFPEIVSVGCDSASAASCNTTPAPSSNVYSRELSLLQPTGPVQAIEGMGNVSIGGFKVLGFNVAGVVNGDVMAGGSLTIPAVGIAVNTSWPATGILPTFGYGSSVSASITTANLVHLSGFCAAGTPSTTCMIKRPTATVTATSCTLCSTGITCSSCTGGGYNSGVDTFTLTGGTATFAGGDYVFCNFSATGTSTIKASPSSTTPVRIFVLPPNTSPCSAQGYTQTSGVWNGGNFTDTGSGGLANSLLGTVNGVTSTLDPSGLQIYVAGDGSYDNANTVTIGSSSQGSPLTVGALIYAPTSAVTVTTSACSLNLLGLCTLLNSVATVGGVFSGSIVGDNTTITAGVITQDLDLGNYPIESGANAFRVNQYVLCDTSVTRLTNTLSADTSGC